MVLKCELCGKEIQDEEYYKVRIPELGELAPPHYHKSCLTQMTVGEFGSHFQFDVIENLDSYEIGVYFHERSPLNESKFDSCKRKDDKNARHFNL